MAGKRTAPPPPPAAAPVAPASAATAEDKAKSIPPLASTLMEDAKNAPDIPPEDDSDAGYRTARFELVDPTNNVRYFPSRTVRGKKTQWVQNQLDAGVLIDVGKV